MKILILVMLLSGSVYAANPYVDSLNARAAAKEQKRWTIADWLATKQKVNLMDQWLAANTSESWFELYLGAHQQDYEITLASQPDNILTDSKIIQYHAGFFVSLLGFEYATEEDEDIGSKSDTLSVKLRLLGNAEQSTNFTLHYGQRQTSESSYDEELKNDFYGASFRLYILGGFGLYASYLDFQESEVSVSNTPVMVKSTTTDYGAFFDLSFLQIYGIWSVSKNMVDSVESELAGAKLGLRFYL